MVIRNRVMMLIWLTTVALLAFAEGRWHGLRYSREHRVHEASATDSTELSSGDEDDYRSELTDSLEQYVRHRRHYPTPPTLLEDEASDESVVGSEEDEQYDDSGDELELELELEQEQEKEEEKEMLQRAARHRLIDRRRHRSHVPQMRHLHLQPHHRHHERNHEPSTHRGIADPLEMTQDHGEDYIGVRDLLRYHSRGKRHNRKRAWTEKDRKSYLSSRPKPGHFDTEKTYEVEVREAQNSSLCNYTVIPIPDPGGRIPRELEHIKCNHVGSKCQDRGTYCCIQTYRHMEVVYESGKTETLKVYSGCVCSLRIYGTLEPYAPKLEIDY